MNAWWGAATAVGVMCAGGWLLRRVEAWSHSMDASSDAWLADARKSEVAVPSQFGDVLGLSPEQLRLVPVVQIAEAHLTVAVLRAPEVLQAQAIVDEYAKVLAPLYVEVEHS